MKQIFAFLIAQGIGFHAYSWSHDFSIEGSGQGSYLSKLEADDSFLTYNLIQTSRSDKNRCVLNLRLTSLKRQTEETRLSDDYITFDKSFCQFKTNQFSVTFGALSPEWTQTNGLNSANLFSSYDVRYSFFLDKKMQFYNPGIQFDYFTGALTYRLYLGQMKNSYKIDSPLNTNIIERYDKPEHVDLATGLFASFDDWDINLSWQNLTDRIGVFQLNQTTFEVERTYHPTSAWALSFSTTAHGWGVLRGDYLLLENRTLADETLTPGRTSHSLFVFNFETPTLLDTIYSLQYSTQHLGLDKKYFKTTNAEWMTHSFRTNIKDENVMQLDFAYNHFDRSQLFRGQYTWPNKRLTELTIGAESYQPTSESLFYEGFKDLFRVFLKFDIKVSI